MIKKFNPSFKSFLLFTLFMMSITFGVSAFALTPAGTVIGNAATAKYFDSANNEYTTTSNIVQTIVTEICGTALLPDSPTVVTKDGVPGQKVNMPFSIKNTGNGQNTYDLTTTSLGPGNYTKAIYLDANSNGIVDPGESAITSVTLEQDGTANLVVLVTLPPTATLNETFTLNAESTAPAGCQDSATGTINITNDANIVANKAVDNMVAKPGDTLTYIINFQNVGLKAAYSSTFSVNGANSDGILVKDQIPSGSSYVTGSAAGIPTVSPNGYVVYSSNGTNWTTVAGAVNYIGFFMPDANPTNGTSEPVLDVNQQGYLTFKVTVNNPFTEADNTVDNFANVDYKNSTGTDKETTTNTTSTYVPPSATADISLGGLDGWVYASGSWSTSNTTPTAEEDDSPRTVYTNDNYVNNIPAGGWVTFLHQAKNNSNNPDIINISLDILTSLPTGAIVEFWNFTGSAKLIDTNGDGLVDLGTVGAGLTKDFTVKIFIPANAGAKSLDGTVDWYATIRAISVNYPTEYDLSRDNFDGIVAADVDIAGRNLGGDTTNDQSDGNVDGTNDSDDTTTTVNPGDTAVVPLEVVNTGGYSDAFDLTATGNPPGTTVTFYTDPDCNPNTQDGKIITNTGLLGGTTLRSDVTNSNILPVYNIANFSVGDKVIVGLDGVEHLVTAIDTVNLTITIDVAITKSAGALVSESICIVMLIKTEVNTPAGTTNIVVKAESQSSGTSDNMDVALTVNEICNISVAPDGSDQLSANSSTTYNHTVTNNGNVTVNATINIPTTPTKLTYSLIYNGNVYDPIIGFTVTLGAGTKADFQVSVQAPSSVSPGTVESITVQATTNKGCSDTLTDTTTVIEGFLQLTKSVDKAQAAPGEVLTYTINYKNIGSQIAKNVFITDLIPNYTTYESVTTSSLCLDADCNGACDGTAYTNASGDDQAEYDSVNNLVRFRVGTGANATTGGTLAPGESGCVIFKVKIE